MPPFVVPYAPQQIFTPNGRLVDLIRLQGEDAARAAEQRGQIQAQMWSGVGNAVQGGVNSIIQATDPRRKIEAAQAQMVQGQAADAADLRAGQRGVDAMMGGDTMPAGDAGPRQQSYLTADGLFDIPKMNAALASAGHGHLAPELLKGAETINDQITKHQDLEDKAAKEHAILIGDLAHGAITLNKTVGMPLSAAMDFVVQPALATKRIKPEDYAQFKGQIDGLPPEQQIGALNAFRDQAAQIAPKKTIGKDAIETDRYDRTTATNVVPDKKPDYTINGQRFNGATNQPLGDQVAPLAAPAAAQTHTMRLKDVGDVPVDYVPNKDGSGGKWMYQGEDVTGRLTAIPSAAITIHNEQMKGLDLPAWATDASRPSGADANALDANIRMTPNGLHQAAVNYIANGQFPPTGRGTDPIAVAQRAAITSKVGAIAADAGMDVPSLRSFYKANGASLTQQQKAADAATAFLATADKNSELLEKTLAKIPDMGSPLLNAPLRSLDQRALGSVDMAQFKTYLQSVQNEYAKILTQPNLSGQLTDSARKEAEQLVSPDATVAQIVGSLQALRAEGGNRLQSIGDQILKIQKRMQIGSQGASDTTVQPLKVGGFTVVVK